MSIDHSVTSWIAQLKAGQRAAVQKLWERYFGRLVRLARTRLSAVPRQAADEEDIALSAFESFCLAAEAGRFPKLEDRDDLWQILVLIANRKATELARREKAQKKGGGKVYHASALPAGDGQVGAFFTDLVGREPDPGIAAEVAEQCQRLLRLLPDEGLRRVALWKLEGYTNEEIARKLDRSVVTVERKLRRIRQLWQPTLIADE